MELHTPFSAAAIPASSLPQAKENLELRMKYADEPMKFLENEVDLLSIIRGLAQVCEERRGAGCGRCLWRQEGTVRDTRQH